MVESITVITLLLSALDRIDLQAIFDRDPYELRRRATSVPAVKAWVRRWSSELKLGWTDGEIAEVTRHLVRRYYKFDSATPQN